MCVRFSVEASRNALAANAPEEVLRVVELALPSASTPEQRVGLLDARDQALDMLRRPGDRMQGLAELAALAEALGDARLEIDVRLRRAAAMRTAEEFDRAAELAREVRDLAVEEGDREGELAACMELGQDLLRATAGESFTPVGEGGRPRRRRRGVPSCDGAGASSSATSRPRPPRLRELGVVQLGGVRAWFIEQVEQGLHIPIAQRVAAGEVLEDIMPELRDRARVHGDVRAAPARARALRAARRPARRDVHDHRARLPELGGRHPLRRQLGATHRGDPPAHVAG